MALTLTEDSDTPSHRYWITAQGPKNASRGVRRYEDQDAMRTLGNCESVHRSIADLRHEFRQRWQISAKVFAQPNSVVDLHLASRGPYCPVLFRNASGSTAFGQDIETPRFDQLHQRGCQCATGLGVAPPRHTGHGLRLSFGETPDKRVRPIIAFPCETPGDHALLEVLAEKVAIWIVLWPRRLVVPADVGFQGRDEGWRPARHQTIAQKPMPGPQTLVGPHDRRSRWSCPRLRPAAERLPQCPVFLSR
jgi:hypothetical protein